MSTTTNSTAALPFQPSSMSPAHLAAVSFLARYSGATHALYRTQLGRWFTWCETNGLDPLIAIQRAHVELYIRHLGQAGLMDSSVNTMMHAVRGYFRFAHIDGTITADPAVYARLPTRALRRPPPAADVRPGEPRSSRRRADRGVIADRGQRPRPLPAHPGEPVVTAPAADGVTSAVGIRPTTPVLLQDRYGPPDLLRLERVARPEPAAGEVLLAVAAAGVNPADVLTRKAVISSGPSRSQITCKSHAINGFLRTGGSCSQPCARVVVWSANVPTPQPNTSSPTVRSVTPEPTAAPVPARSDPRRG